MRYFIYLSAVLLIAACGGDAPATDSSTPRQKATETPLPPEPTPLTLEEQLAEIKAEYALISQEMAGEVYQKDSITYTCEDEMVSGTAFVYSDTEEVRLVVNDCIFGDHAGEVQYWYFQDGEPFFVLAESGSWQFGGPIQEDEQGNEYPGTIDKIEQERYYLAGGKVIRQLHKAFEIKSWEKGPAADEIPNKEVETKGELPVGYTAIKQIAATKAIECDGLGL